MADSTVDALTAAAALDGTEEFYAVQGGADRKVTGTQIAALVRTRLAANADYYVDKTTGSDSNVGSLASPWATIQYASDYVSSHLDIAGKTVTIHIADSVTTYAGVTLRSFVGGGYVVFLGNNTTLGNVKIGDGVSIAGYPCGSFFAESTLGGTTVWVSGFQFVPTAGPAIDFDGAGRGPCLLGEPTFLLSTKNKFSGCQANSYVLIGNITDSTTDTSIIDGTALNLLTPKGFYFSTQFNEQMAFLYGPSFSVTGTVTFTRAFAIVAVGGATITGAFGGAGTINGSRFEVGPAGTLFMDTLTALPGSLPGTNYGGQIGLGFPNQCYVGPIPTTKSLQTPSTGFSITVSDNVGLLLLKPAATLATGTITMPANPIDQQRLLVVSTKTVTALTVSPNSGQSVLGNPSAIAAGTAINAVYNYSDTTWYISSSPAGSGSGMAIGSPVTSGTSGSVLFADGSSNLAQNNANFFWDDSNLRLKVGSVATPTGAYYINGLPALYEVPNGSGNNWFEGNAGNTTVTGSGNMGTGDGALAALTGGNNNVAVGRIAGQAITGGSSNFAFGSSALSALTGFNSNVAIGAFAMAAGQPSGCTAIGDSALQSITASGCVAIGGVAGYSLTSGDANILIGSNTLQDATFAQNTITIGSSAGRNLTSSNYNTLIGFWRCPAVAMSDVIAITDGHDTANNPIHGVDYNYTTAGVWSFQNLAVKIGLHVYNTTDGLFPPTNYERGVFDWNVTSNVLTIGTQKGGTGSTRNLKFVVGGTNQLDYGVTTSSVWTFGSSRIDLTVNAAPEPAIYAVYNAAGTNWFEGNAGNTTLSGSRNFGTGDSSLAALTSGTDNVALGSLALSSLTTGIKNTAIGSASGRFLTTGNINFCLGADTLTACTTGVGNLAIGSSALASTTNDSGNIAIGTNSLVALGLAGAGGGSNSDMLAIGSALTNVQTGSVSVAIGGLAGQTTVSSIGDVFIGAGAGQSLAPSGNSNTMIGCFAGSALTSGGSNTLIGRWAGPAGAMSSVIAFSDGGSNVRLDYGYTNAATWTSPVAVCVTPVAVGSLPAAGIVGRRHFVTDATVTTFASVVAGTGGNPVPVYDDGTNWRIG